MHIEVYYDEYDPNKVEQLRLPRASICSFLPKPFGRPLAFFIVSAETDVTVLVASVECENPPDPGSNGAAVGTGVRARAIEPSGPYFPALSFHRLLHIDV